ncbi:chemotaxis protein CheW [Oceanobacillus halotolerans]|uniref:chemotaxis protein CheW n=1 Tax=Oceanobacillus halotolerans TaxID=2663380 RepID=UPI0013D915D6|nr:chemotaxis protein CheW [Oceanobacillus halotolerans]
MKEFSKVIVFMLNNQKFAVDIQQVRSIERIHNITEIPRSSQFIKGILELREEITPIIDLKDRLKIGEVNQSSESRVIVVSFNSIQIGLLVDSAKDVINVNPNKITSTPKYIGGISEMFIKGVAKLEDDLLILLDLDHILSLEEFNEVEEIIDT